MIMSIAHDLVRDSAKFNMAGAKRNGAITFFELVHNWVNTFY